MNLVKIIVLGFVGLLMVIPLSLAIGTCVWLIWPLVMPNIFPALTTNLVIASHPTWIQCVLLTWLLNVLVKATVSIKE
jgi:hypothetical protein